MKAAHWMGVALVVLGAAPARSLSILISVAGTPASLIGGMRVIAGAADALGGRDRIFACRQRWTSRLSAQERSSLQQGCRADRVFQHRPRSLQHGLDGGNGHRFDPTYLVVDYIMSTNFKPGGRPVEVEAASL